MLSHNLTGRINNEHTGIEKDQQVLFLIEQPLQTAGGVQRRRIQPLGKMFELLVD